ncbi:hypothetical protein BZA05DRAFT_415758 [Tricharina praecox]|uniref:uncharacterized protein n=1 Tax=Tricharina praecox TaxID=43433 RepID=UPI0022210E63|nr:uncharacterized protein BZA05DRAFT_415758 [Tricharina praecox]KAI5857055.1 hypothetical protein BZA05DRAFT_415758 [Tricharina praecox]
MTISTLLYLHKAGSPDSPASPASPVGRSSTISTAFHKLAALAHKVLRLKPYRNRNRNRKSKSKSKKSRFPSAVASSPAIIRFSPIDDDDRITQHHPVDEDEDPYTTYDLLAEPVFYDDDDDNDNEDEDKSETGIRKSSLDSNSTSKNGLRKSSLDSSSTYYSARSFVSTGCYNYQFESLTRENKIEMLRVSKVEVGASWRS